MASALLLLLHFVHVYVCLSTGKFNALAWTAENMEAREREREAGAGGLGQQRDCGKDVDKHFRNGAVSQWKI